MRNPRGRSKSGGGLAGRRILLIVTGGIAAYKAAFLVRLARCGGAEVRVVMTDAAAKFITPLTFEVLSGHAVLTDLFAPRTEPGVVHIELARWADRIIVAPATADIIAKAAHGIADDLASTILVSTRCPVIYAPAMNEGIWNNAAVRRNVDVLRRDGRTIVGPVGGELACGEEGQGRMVEPEEILRAAEATFAPGDLSGVRFLVTAGRTEEELDPVRYLSNRSSGRMGFAIAAAARARGARVTVVHGPVDVEPPAADSRIAVTSAAQMKTAVLREMARCDCLVMAAAVADFAPARREPRKMKRSGTRVTLELRPTVDILAAAAARRSRGQILVGFALETDDAEANARRKAREKRCDYLVLNLIGSDTGIGTPTNRITVFKGDRKLYATPLLSKEEAAGCILDTIAADGRLKRGRA